MKQGNDKSQFQCYLSELHYEPVGHLGYLVRLEKKHEDVNLGALKHSWKMPSFQFVYWDTANRYVREIREDECKKIINIITCSISSFIYEINS